VGFLAGKRALIVGLATERSIAYGIAAAAEFYYGKKLDQLLTKAGVRHEFHTTPGEHEWKAWRHLLAQLMPELFQRAR